MRKIFSFTGAKKIVFGNGSLLTLASHIKEHHAQNPLVVIDKNLAKTGLAGKNRQHSGIRGHQVHRF